ncbi:26S proteasome non-ATPase regulatory subunit 11 homolog [Arachis stenosperma]|uniref:26S proteasome non-ATPase regulatory subunit 11 homolog n=1 Tax=Arachis stenosperma TaxID=217475 RepID=UPI0025AB7BCF|nr:26S proteasome non-ATPase regulatory subunit 11 homolog [Arachis stenosperma]
MEILLCFLSSSFQYPVVKIVVYYVAYVYSEIYEKVIDNLLEMDLSLHCVCVFCSSCPVAKIPRTSALQIALCKEMVQWTRAEKCTFLRQRVEVRLAALLMENKEFSEVLTLLSSSVKEVRRLDDKLLLVDIELLESKLHFSLRNLPKAKAALTAARTAANAIYVPPAQQGTIDLQSGLLHAEEKD